MTHELKIRPEFFEAVFKGEKTFEERLNDRCFEIGGTLVLGEYEPSTHATRPGYTGRYIKMEVRYILRGGQFGIDPDYVVMGIKPTGL